MQPGFRDISTATGTLQGRGLCSRVDVQACAKASGLGKDDLAARARRLPPAAASSRTAAAYKAQAGAALSSTPLAVKILRASAFSSSCGSAARRAPRHRRPAGRKRPRRSAAFPWAPRGRRRPSRADCRRGRGRSRTSRCAEIAPCPGATVVLRRAGAAPAQMQHDQVETALDRVRNPVIAVKNRQSRLCHDHAIERVRWCGVGTAAKSP